MIWGEKVMTVAKINEAKVGNLRKKGNMVHSSAGNGLVFFMSALN